MTRKIKFALIFVLTYILAFFVWWTFSLIDLSRQRSELVFKYETERKVNAQAMVDQSIKKGVDSSIINLRLTKEYPDIIIKWKGEKAKVSVCNKLLNRNEKDFLKEINKYLLEGISMFLLIAAGVIWIFLKVNQILNLSKQQNNFLLSVSHELKTPIASTQLASQTLSLNMNKLGEEQKMKLVKNVETNSKRLDKLIDQMLLLTKIEGAQYVFNSEKNDLKDLVNSIIVENQIEENSHLTVINNIPSNTFVHFDRLLMDLCLSNLLQNAIKYSPDGGLITFDYDNKGKFHLVCVSDEGIGIPNDEKGRIFDKFYRVGSEDTRTSKGTGLGLYLVKQILHKQKGSIKVKDNVPNGSIFVLKIKN